MPGSSSARKARGSPRAFFLCAEIAAFVVAVGGALAWTQPEVAGVDLWWLLASGREIATAGAVPAVDSFSFTFQGRPWTNHEWLWALASWKLYRIGPQFVAWANLGVVAGVLGLAYALGRRRGGSPPAAVLAVWGAAMTAHWFFDIRPHVVTLGLSVFLLWSRDRRWAPWTWPAVMLLWVNLHTGFLFGLGVIGVVVGLRAIERGTDGRRPVLRTAEWVPALGALAACLVNPWGAGIVRYPLSYLEGGSVFRSIQEWRAPGLGLDPVTYEGRFFWLALASLAALPLAWKRARPEAVVALAALAMAVTSRRFIALFAVTAVPLAALAVAAALGRLRARWPASATPAATAAWLALAAVPCAAWWSDVRLRPRLLERWTQAQLAPSAALDVLRRLAPRRPFHDYTWGGLMMLHAPEIPVFLDARANTLYDAALAVDYLRVRTVQPGFSDVLARWGVDAAFVPAGSPLVGALQRATPPWRMVYRDSIAAILLPADAARAAQAAVAGDPAEPAVALRDAQRLAAGGQGGDAIGALERILEGDPLFLPAYHELALCHARAGDRQGVERTLARARAAYPRGKRRWLAYEGQARETLGDPAGALAAYRSALSLGPFGESAALVARVRALERRERGGS